MVHVPPDPVEPCNNENVRPRVAVAELSLHSPRRIRTARRPWSPARRPKPRGTRCTPTSQSRSERKTQRDETGQTGLPAGCGWGGEIAAANLVERCAADGARAGAVGTCTQDETTREPDSEQGQEAGTHRCSRACTSLPHTPTRTTRRERPTTSDQVSRNRNTHAGKRGLTSRDGIGSRGGCGAGRVAVGAGPVAHAVLERRNGAARRDE